MVVSTIIIGVNLGTVVPQIFSRTIDNRMERTRTKTVIVIIALIYFAIIFAIILSPTKPESLLDSSCATDEVSNFINNNLL